MVRHYLGRERKGNEKKQDILSHHYGISACRPDILWEHQGK